jgi:hypothetical protein
MYERGHLIEVIGRFVILTLQIVFSLSVPCFDRCPSPRFFIFGHLCTGDMRRVTHDEIADAIGENVREILGTRANLLQISQREQQHAAKAVEIAKAL